MHSRRDAIKQLAGLVALSSVTRPLMAAEDTSSALPDEDGVAALVQVAGVQLYTLRDAMKADVEGTLARVAKIGYREVEFAGYFGKTPAEIAAILKRNGLRSPSAHIPIDEIRTKWEQSLDAAETIGQRYLVCPWLAPDQRSSAADDWRKLAGELNKAGEAAQKRGIQLAYHNHDFEFAPIAGTNAMEILLAEMDPKLVKIELDLYWVSKVERDPVALFKAYPGRFPLVHVKDMAKDGSFAEVGAGTINFRRIFAHAREAGIRHFFVEQDVSKDPFASITQSYAAVRAIPANIRRR